MILINVNSYGSQMLIIKICISEDSAPEPRQGFAL